MCAHSVELAIKRVKIRVSEGWTQLYDRRTKRGKTSSGK